MKTSLPLDANMFFFSNQIKSCLEEIDNTSNPDKKMIIARELRNILDPILYELWRKNPVPYLPEVLRRTYFDGNLIYKAKPCIDYVTGRDLDNLSEKEIRLSSYDFLNGLGTFVINYEDFETDDVKVCADRWRQKISQMSKEEFEIEDFSC